MGRVGTDGDQVNVRVNVVEHFVPLLPNRAVLGGAASNIIAGIGRVHGQVNLFFAPVNLCLHIGLSTDGIILDLHKDGGIEHAQRNQTGGKYGACGAGGLCLVSSISIDQVKQQRCQQHKHGITGEKAASGQGGYDKQWRAEHIHADQRKEHLSLPATALDA